VDHIAASREALAIFEDIVALAPEEREAALEARTAGRPELRAMVSRLEVADRDTRLKTGALSLAVEIEAMPERIGAYRIVECVGRGGMGSVYKAERDAGDFTHTVAIKVIKPGLFGQTLVERFARERQTLAALTHPNIARLYDGGQTELGVPYIVMEFVEGQPLMSWLKTQTPSRRERAALFLDICSAVSFAHGRLIVHRDLTPSNVLVEPAGAAKLIDFGIARSSDEDVAQDGATRAGTHTPGYAAPERLAGAPATTAIDIFSLGRLLEDLIPPGRNDRELKAIAARACATDPNQRFPTADALADEVRAWLKGDAVASYSNAAHYTFSKFMARRRGLVGAALATLTLLIAALGFTINANIRAEHERAAAETRFQQTRAIANAMLFDVFDEVSQNVGSTRAREILARTGLEYLQALSSDVNAPVDVRVEAALGFLRLSQVVGGGQAGQLGRERDATALLAQAEAIVAPLYQDHQDDASVAEAMAAIRVEQAASNLFSNNEYDLARTQAQEAQTIIEPFARDNVRVARIYLVAIHGEADSYAWQDDYARARDGHARAEAFAASLPDDMQNSVEIIRPRAANLRLLAEALHGLGDDGQALPILDQVVELQRRALATAPNHPNYIRSLSIALWYRAVVNRSNNRDDIARASIEESAALARRLRDRDPDDAGAVRMVAISSEVLAQVLADVGRFDESERVGDEVINAHRDLVARADGAAGARRSLAAALATNGGNFYNAGAYARACERWQESRDIYRTLNQEGALSQADQNEALAQMQDYLRRACDPPRPGLDDDL
jgi:serine/threonine-protein kinase